MKLIEIKDLFEMDSGAPCPSVISNDRELFLTFFLDEDSDFKNQKTIIIKFKIFLKYSFGFPNDEMINQHPYSKLGLESYSFYELDGSDYIETLEKIGKKHSYYNAMRWKKFKHYILTFHDNMFECIAEDFEIIDPKEFDLHRKITEFLSNVGHVSH